MPFAGMYQTVEKSQPEKLAEFLKEHRAGTLTVPEAAPPAGEQEAGHEE